MDSLTDVSPRILLFCLYVSSNFALAATTALPYNTGTIGNRLPSNLTFVPEIKRFLPVSSQFNEGQVELVNGTVSPSFIYFICRL